jgi:Protein of unknown function (DUF2490)
MTATRYRIIIILVFPVFSHFQSFAQQSNFGNWFMYFGNQYFHKSWDWYNEVQYRNYNFIGDLEQLVLRTGIGHDLTEHNNNVMLGFAYIYSERYPSGSDKKISANEFRIFQQFITRENYGRIFLLHRYRIEERFFPKETDVRFRYFLRLNIPLTSKAMSKNTLYLSAYNEIFLNAEKPVFDQDRVYGALGYVINKNIRTELGVMTQFFENRKKSQLQIAFYNNIPFEKKAN